MLLAIGGNQKHMMRKKYILFISIASLVFLSSCQSQSATEEVNTLNQRIESLQNSNLDYINKINELDNENTKLRDENTKIKGDNNDIKEKYTELEGRNTKLERENADLNHRVDVLTLESINSMNNSTMKEPNIIVAGDTLLGAYINNEWRKGCDLDNYIRDGGKYQVYSINKLLGHFTGGNISYSYPTGENLSINTNQKFNVAMSADWNGLPRVPEVISNNNQIYKNIVSSILKENHLENVEANIKQIYRIDLEGDGVDEVLINASNIDFNSLSVTHEKGTYSIIILRKVVNGKVENILLRKSIYTKDSEFSEGITDAYKITSIIDADGDGKMELILESKYYEGDSYSLLEELNDKFIEVLVNGWGA